MLQMEEDVILLGAHAATLADFDCHGPADHVPGCQILSVGGVTLHETLALAIRQVPPLTPYAFGNQAARAVNTRGMKLHELQVLQGQTSAQDHRIPITSTRMGRRTGEISAAVATGRQNDHLRAKTVQLTRGQIQGRDSPADPILHEQVDGEVLDKKLGPRGAATVGTTRAA